MIPAHLACTLNGANEFDSHRSHSGSYFIDIVHAEGDNRTCGEKRVKFLFGTIEFHFCAIGQLKPCNLRFVPNGLHTHYIAKELHHLFKLIGPQS
jgi:hypothetical protein